MEILKGTQEKDPSLHLPETITEDKVFGKEKGVSSVVDPILFYSDPDPAVTIISGSVPDPDSDPGCL